jgi:hypothetical protein
MDHAVPLSPCYNLMRTNRNPDQTNNIAAINAPKVKPMSCLVPARQETGFDPGR